MRDLGNGTRRCFQRFEGLGKVHDVQYGDLPTWVAAIGTAGALAVAFLQIRTERRARKAREAEERRHTRRRQAVRISSWIASSDDMAQVGWQDSSSLPRYGAVLLNNSEEPVYEVAASLVSIQGAGPSASKGDGRLEYRAYLSVVPPGRHLADLGTCDSWPSGRAGVDLLFTDATGVHWLRRANGALDEVDAPSAEYYSMPRPVGWVIPTLLK
jgi:hypothetical protein